jgi:starch-binding outer membrane protein, SusD/RagB family
LQFFNRGRTGQTRDPRVLVDSLGVGSGTRLPLYQQLNYAARGANMPLATGTEAALIRAESLLRGGQSAEYLSILNPLRASIGLAALPDPVNPGARVDQLFEERALWLWLTSHRLGDLRRLIRQYGRVAEQVFPVGVTIFGEPYGTDVNLPIPIDEANNPNFQGGCLNRDA